MKVKALLMFGLVLTLLMVGATGPTAADGPHPWPMYMGDPQRSGTSPYLGPQTNTIAWTAPYGSVSHPQPAIGAGGTAYFNGHYLCALNSDGGLEWKLYMQGRHSPAIGPDGTIYACSLMNDRSLFAVEPSGTIKWSYHLGALAGAPLVGPDGVVYVGAGPLYAINPDGTLRWRYDEVLTGGSSSIAMMPDGTILVPESASLKAVNPDGTLKWRALVSAGGIAVAPDSTIYVASEYGLSALNPDGTMRWRFKSPLCGGGDWRSISPPAIAPDGTVYYGRCQALHAVDPNGELLWYLRIGSKFRDNPAVGSDGTVYYASSNAVSAINPDGTVKWSSYFGGKLGVYGAALSRDGTLYVSTGTHVIFAFRDLPPTCLETDTGTGTACFAPGQGVIEELETLPVPANPPAGYTFPHGLFSFKVTGLADDQAVVVNVELPSPVPAGTKWWKYHDGQWHDYNIPITISGNTITITLTDGGAGDIDDIAGQITDPGGPGYPLSLGYTVGWEGQPINKVAVMAPWIVLLAAIAGTSLLVWRRRIRVREHV